MFVRQATIVAFVSCAAIACSGTETGSSSNGLELPKGKTDVGFGDAGAQEDDASGVVDADDVSVATDATSGDAVDAAGTNDATAPDLAETAPPDIADVAQVGETDVLPDSAGDVAPEIVEDVAPEIGPDAAEDAAPEVEPDAEPDVPPEVGPSDAPDITEPVDVGAEDTATPDTGATGAFQPTGCDLKVNENTTGTVNPFISPARNGQFYVSYAAVANPNGNLFMGWEDPKTCKTVEGPLQVNKKAGEVYYWGNIAVVSDAEGNFYAIWESSAPGSHLAFSYSESGKDFSDSVQADSASDNGLRPTIAVPKTGKPHIAWTGYNLKDYVPWYAHNETVLTGGTWSTGLPVPVLDVGEKVQVDAVTIAVDSKGTIYVAYMAWRTESTEKKENRDIFVSRSTDGGVTWSAPVQINDVKGTGNVYSANFLVVAPDDTLHVVWQDSRDSYEPDIYSDASADGLTWGKDVKVNDNDYRQQEDPSLTAGTNGACKGTLYALWQDNRSNKSMDIYGAKSTDGGKTWSKNELLTPSSDGDQMNPAIAVDIACMVGIAWRDSATNDKFDIKATFFKW